MLAWTSLGMKRKFWRTWFFQQGGDLNGKISLIEDGFKAKVEAILSEIEEKKKQMNDEIERKRTEAARIEEERKIQELNKVHPEKSKSEIRKSWFYDFTPKDWKLF